MKFKKHMSLIPSILIGLILIIWPQLIINPAQADCISHSPKPLKAMDSTEPLIINESLIIEDIKKASKAIATQGNNARNIALQFGELDTTSLNENEVKPFNSDIESIVLHNENNQLGSINFRFRLHSLMSLSALQKAFGDYHTSPRVTSHNGAVTIYSIGFTVKLNGKNINIYVRRRSPDLTVEKIEVNEISIIG
jgi:hypothetical protein